VFSAAAHIYRLGVKELRSLGADPILLAFIFYVFTFAIYQIATGMKFEVESARVAVVDEDHSELSRRIASAMLPPLFKTAIRFPPTNRRGDGPRPLCIRHRNPAEIRVRRAVGKTPRADQCRRHGHGPRGQWRRRYQNIILQEVASYLRKDGGGTVQPVELVIRAKFNPI